VIVFNTIISIADRTTTAGIPPRNALITEAGNVPTPIRAIVHRRSAQAIIQAPHRRDGHCGVLPASAACRPVPTAGPRAGTVSLWVAWSCGGAAGPSDDREDQLYHGDGKTP
jgi:hypothetical protein